MQTNVLIVGGGPVGMVLSRVLSKFKVTNMVLEKHTQISKHPKAHYLSFRTCEILTDLLDDHSFIAQQMARSN